MRLCRRAAEDDEYRTGWIELQPHLRPAQRLTPDRRRLDQTRIGMPQLRRFVGDAEGAGRFGKILPLVGDEIDIVVANDTMNEDKIGMAIGQRPYPAEGSAIKRPPAVRC